MRSVGVHQGLAPVLDVVRDARWGRVEETIGEDPYLVGTIGTAYVRGLESAGIVATLKHFVGYSASRAGRNLAPVSVGPRELADVLLPPFEMAIREGGARSVMHSYTDIDGMPSAADESLLTGLLRDTWGFDGTVVADYFGDRLPQDAARRRGDWGEAAALALHRGRRRRTAHREDLRRAAGRGRPVGRRRPRRSSTAPCAGCCARRRARPARPGLGSPCRPRSTRRRRRRRGRAARHDRPGQRRQPRASPARSPSRRSCC